MSVFIFKLPDLGEGLPDAEIVEWHAAEGDQVQQGDLLLSVETDKAVVEVPSPHSGKLVRCHGQQGEVLKVGAPLAEIEVAGKSTAEDAGTVVGKMDTTSTTVKEKPATVSRETPGIKATPAVRALAKRLNVDLSVAKPSGPDGVFTVDDVKRVASLLADLEPMEPLRGARRAMARTMTMAGDQVVPVTLHDDADIQSWSNPDEISLRLIRALIAGCVAEPGLNAWYDNQAIGRRLRTDIDLGIAVDSEDGLFVPVLKNSGQLSPESLRSALEQVKEAVKSRSIQPEAMRGATITLTNFGTLAGRYATPVVVPPAVAILGAGSARDAVVAEQGAAVVHRIIPLSLTFDHRCVTGGEAARFLSAVISDLEQAG